MRGEDALIGLEITVASGKVASLAHEAMKQ
jgi:hypothetical protein